MQAGAPLGITIGYFVSYLLTSNAPDGVCPPCNLLCAWRRVRIGARRTRGLKRNAAGAYRQDRKRYKRLSEHDGK